jgi:transcriptional regulator with XRE-family HTH domain
MAKSTHHPTHYYFRCNVRARLLKSGMTQLQLATASGVSRTQLNQVLNGKRPLSLRTMEAVSLAFGELDYRVLLRKPPHLELED